MRGGSKARPLESSDMEEATTETQNINKIGLHWLTNAVWSQTGYGGQAKLIIPRLQARGYPMSMTAYYGLQGHTLMMNDTMIFPCGYHPYGMDVADGNAKISKADILLTNVDIWVCEPQNFQNSIWVPWFPIDSATANPMIRAKLPLAFARFCMSKHGTNIVKELGYDCTFVPCAVDTKVFAPANRADALNEVNLHIQEKIPTDAFVVSMVAMNKGAPSRKAFYQQMRAFKTLYDKHPDSVLYMHTIKSELGEQGGINLVEIATHLGLEIGKNVFFPDALMIINGYPDVFLNAVYNASDVFMSVTMGEGFGIPILEAQSAGCPVITGDWTAMSENTFSGWKVGKEDATEVWTMLSAIQYEPDYRAIAEQLEMAYTMRGNQEYRERARKGALKYDIEKVIQKFWLPQLDILTERLKDRPTFTEPAP